MNFNQVANSSDLSLAPDAIFVEKTGLPARFPQSLHLIQNIQQGAISFSICHGSSDYCSLMIFVISPVAIKLIWSGIVSGFNFLVFDHSL